MPPGLFQRTARGSFLAAALVCLLLGSLLGWKTHRFVGGAERVEAVVFYMEADESNAMLVRVPARNGRAAFTIPVRLAWWSPFWEYLPGAKVAVLYDPKRNYDVPSPFGRGRVDTPAQLWSGTVLWLAAAALFLAGWIWSRLLGARDRAHFGITTD